jgi:hypothetical protein
MMTIGNNGVKDFISVFDFAAPAAIGNSCFNIVDSTVGGNVGLGLANTDNTNASSDCCISIQVAGSSAGDPCIGFGVSGAGTYTIGTDNSDGDAFKITDGGRPSTGTLFWKMTSTGERTMPLQPCFLAYVNGTVTNVTGDGTNYIVAFGTEAFDQNSDYNTGTYTFTAPVTGRYYFKTVIWIENGAASNQTIMNIAFVTSDVVFYQTCCNPYNYQRSDGYAAWEGSTIAAMDAGDTCYVALAIHGGSKTIDIWGQAYQTRFCGTLLC